MAHNPKPKSTAFQASSMDSVLIPAAPSVQPVTNPSGVVASSHNSLNSLNRSVSDYIGLMEIPYKKVVGYE